jgi:SAM-dependent methyltransferase
MAQYQSFPDASGDSRTLEKLKLLKLPDLSNRSFLDVGCNEGFFCGFASFTGAKCSVGVDQSPLFIERARQRFPTCEFHLSGWDDLPPGPFDVILLASALHYANDQPALIHRLVEQLSPDGVLVLELGIASSPNSSWVRVKRGIDEREFPTMSKLREVLHNYAWKWMGRSVSQDGDPVARHVIHISRRRPIAYLLMQPPAFGKTSIAARLFVPAGIPVVSGDQQIALVAKGEKVVSEKLRDAIAQDYSAFRIDESLKRIFDSGAGEELIRTWAEQAGDGGDFALDAYVPSEHHALVEDVVAQLGFLPVQLRWDRVGPQLLPDDAIGDRADAFYMSMAAPGTPRPLPVVALPSGQLRGFVDELSFDDGRLVIRGWAVDLDGRMPDCLGVRINGDIHLIDEFVTQSRPDVQRHLNLAHAQVGYRAELSVPDIAGIGDLGAGFGVFVPAIGDIRLSNRVVKLLAEQRTASR